MSLYMYVLVYFLVITTFWSLGLIAFGGPAAHVAILRDHLVVRRNWINEEQFMELFSIGQVSMTIVPVLVCL
jgi:chromate transport protein ChrA